MALRSIKADDQLGIDEVHINDPDIEQALETWQRAKDERAEKQLAVKNAKVKIEGLTGRLEMPDPVDEDHPQVVRVGRFRITKKFIKGKTVSFATEDRVRMSFGLADEGEEEASEPGYDDTVEEQDAIDRLAASQFAKPQVVADSDDA